MDNSISQHKQTRVPGPRGHWFWGVIDARPDTLSFYLSARRDYGELTRFVALKKFEWYCVAHPQDIEQVLTTSFDSLRKGDAWNRLRLVLGQGVLSSEVDVWRPHRALTQPAFHQSRFADYAVVMESATTAMLERWNEAARSGEAMDISQEMMTLTLLNVGQALFGTNLANYVQPMSQALSVILHFLHLRAFSWEAWCGQRRFKAAIAALDEMIYALMAQRRRERQAGKKHNDLLDILLTSAESDAGKKHSANKDSAAPLTDKQIRDEIATFIVAGHETTAVALSWAWTLLAQHPEIEKRLHDELDTVVGSRSATVDDLPKLPFLKSVVQETMRLYPPIWAISRQTEKPLELRGYTLPKDALLLIFPYVTHRHPDFWENPDAFDPDRFSAARAAGRHQYAYFPFGGGPRACIGAKFALIEMQLALALIAQRFRLKLVPGIELEPALWMSLRHKNPLMMTLHPRGA